MSELRAIDRLGILMKSERLTADSKTSHNDNDQLSTSSLARGSHELRALRLGSGNLDSSRYWRVSGAASQQKVLCFTTEWKPSNRDSRETSLPKATRWGKSVGVLLVFLVLFATQSFGENQQSSTSGGPEYAVASIRPSKFEGSSVIKWDFTPDGLSAKNVTLEMLIQMAYGVEDYQVSGTSKLLHSQTYDVQAKVDDSIADKLRRLTYRERSIKEQPLLQRLLVARFNLALHRETKELPVYALIISRRGPKIENAKPGDTYPNGVKDIYGSGHENIMRMGRGMIIGQAVPIASFARVLTSRVHRPVVDRTGLKGDYDIKLQWTPAEMQYSSPSDADEGGSNASSPAYQSGPSIFTAIQEQLGLKLDSQRAPVEILVIDHVERPSEN